MAYRSTKHEVTKSSPYTMMFGRLPTLPVDVTSRTSRQRYSSLQQLAEQSARQITKAHNEAMGNTQQQQTKDRSEEHTYELQSLIRIKYPDFCLKKKKTQ